MVGRLEPVSEPAAGLPAGRRGHLHRTHADAQCDLRSHGHLRRQPAPMARPPYFSVNSITASPSATSSRITRAMRSRRCSTPQQWDSRILIVLDRDFRVHDGRGDVRLRRRRAAARRSVILEHRAARLVQALFERFAKALQSVFSPASNVTFRLERVETAWRRWRSGGAATCRSARTSWCRRLYRGGADVPHHSALGAQSAAAEARSCRVSDAGRDGSALEQADGRARFSAPR